MTIHKVTFDDGHCLIRITDDDGENFAIVSYPDKCYAQWTIETLQAVIAKCGSKPADVIHHSA